MFSPRFTDDAFQRIKRQTLEGFKQAKSSRPLVATGCDQQDPILAQQHPWVWMRAELKTVGNISLADIQGYYDNHITNKGMKVMMENVAQAEILPAGFPGQTAQPHDRPLPAVAATLARN